MSSESNTKPCSLPCTNFLVPITCNYWHVTVQIHHHHHVPEGLGMFPVPWSSRWSWSLQLFLGRPMFLRPFGLYCSACFGSLFVSILCTCCSHFYWYFFISFTMFCAPVFCLIHWFFSLYCSNYLWKLSKMQHTQQQGQRETCGPPEQVNNLVPRADR